MRHILARRRLAAALLGAAAASAPLGAQTPTPLTPRQQLARDVYEQLVEINTADSVGNVTTAAAAMAERFKAAGFPAADVQLLVPADRPDKGNLVVRYRGKAPNGQKPILLLAHLDVVAANRADWPRDPFTLHEENGYFLGRGTSDDKSMAAIFAANLLWWKREGWMPDRDLILALTADEEGGPKNGVSWLLENHKALIDAAYAINEGGGGTLSPDAKPLFHSIQAAEKVYTDFTLTATNTGGHSSVPRADNAIYQLAAGLSRLAQHRFPVALNAVTRGFFEETAKVEPRAELAAAMRAIVKNPNDAAATATLRSDDRYASMLATSCVATRLAGGHANNALPQRATANVNCRIAPTSSADETRDGIVKALGDTGIKVTFQNTRRFGVVPAPIDPALLAATTALTKQMWGDIPIIPTMSTGATDGRQLRDAGIPTFGVSGLFSVPGEGNAHGRDEKLRVKSFYQGLDFLDQLVRRVSTSSVKM